MARDLLKVVPLRRIYKKLFATFGPQHWWPGETPFEVAVGAILTQNTAWVNAAKAIARLKEENLLDARKLVRVPRRRLGTLIRSSGFFNQKAKRLQIFVRYLVGKYGGEMNRMHRISLDQLRQELLSLSGIGPETADSILLYALSKPTFVVDAYTRRVLARHSFIGWEASYEEIQSRFIDRLPRRVSLFNEYHALLVALGKELCLARGPKCRICPLRRVGKLRLEKNARA